MKMPWISLFLISLLLLISSHSHTENSATQQILSDKALATLRAAKPIVDSNLAQENAQIAVSPTLRPRSYPMQAPTIPHDILGFSINKDLNQCLSCHNRQTAPLMKAPAVALSHYKNREGEYLADVSPRRYFCTQCHVPQMNNINPVNSTFIEAEQVTNKK